MAMLKRQKHGESSTAFSVRVSPELYERFVNYALRERYTQSAAAVRLLDKALNAEEGMPYSPDNEQKQNTAAI